MSPPRSIDAVIINACECEPFLTRDHRLLVERADALVEGAKLIKSGGGTQSILWD